MPNQPAVAASQLWRGTRRHLRVIAACHAEAQAKAGGGAGGIRTLDRALQPYNGLANRRLQPLGHSSMRADMPDTGASRKRQIEVMAGEVIPACVCPDVFEIGARTALDSIRTRQSA